MAYNPEANFWNNKHPLTPTYDRLYAKLVPEEGKCETLEGELIRAASRIHHDYYNNGFGNNWSGAYKYLDNYFGLTANERMFLKPYARGKIRKRQGANYSDKDEVAIAIEGIMARVVWYVSAKEVSGFTPNPMDMFDLSEKSTW